MPSQSYLAFAISVHVDRQWWKFANFRKLWSGLTKPAKPGSY